MDDWANQRWHQHRCRAEGHRRQLAQQPRNDLMACGARHLTVARPVTMSARRSVDGRSSQAERPGLSRFVLPIAGLIALGLCIGGLLVLLDPQGGPNLLASIYDALGNTSGATTCGTGRAISWSPSSCSRRSPWRSASAASGCCSSASARWSSLLRAEVARPDPAVGLRRPRPGAAGGLPGLSGGGNGHAQLPGRDRPASRSPTSRCCSSPSSLAILRNNVIWLVVGTGGSVVLGLIIAGLFDRVRRESLAKTFIFLPLAISLVGAIGHLAVRLRLAARGPAADRAPERDRGRPSAASRSRG